LVYCCQNEFRYFYNGMADLKFKNISISFGVNKVIEDLDLNVLDGEMFVLLGPSGCGKSTILRLIAGLETPDSGEILIGGKLINGIAPKDRNVAMVFQNYALYPHMTIYDNLAFPLKVKKAPKAQIDQLVRKQAGMLGLENLLLRKPRTLSGGQRQRVALGRALVREPSIFLFDEPLSNLDAKLRISTRAEIAALQRKLNATMIYITHDQEEALSLGHRIAILDQGKLQQIGTPREIYEKPASIFCAAFVGSPRINLLEINQPGAEPEKSLHKYFEPMLNKAGLGQNEAIAIGIRPEDLRFSRKKEDDINFEVEIMHIEYAGDRNISYGKIDDFEIRIKSRRIPKAGEGGRADIFVNPDDCHLFRADTGKRIN